MNRASAVKARVTAMECAVPARVEVAEARLERFTALHRVDHGQLLQRRKNGPYAEAINRSAHLSSA